MRRSTHGVSPSSRRGRSRPSRPASRRAPRRHRLAGVTLPGLANAHSHAFHRALRGRTHGGTGTFWTWRDADVRAVADARPRHLPARWPRRRSPRWCWPAITVRRRVPLPAPPTRRGAVRRPERDGRGAARAARRGRRAHHAARHLLPARRDRAWPAEPDVSGGSATATPRRGPSGSTALADVRHAPRIGAAIHSVRAVDPEAIATSSPRWAAARDAAAARPRVASSRPENERAARGPRVHARRATRPPAVRSASGSRAVHATHLYGDDDIALARAPAALVLHLPDDRTRSGRRNRPDGCASRRGRSRCHRLGLACGDRPVRGGHGRSSSTSAWRRCGAGTHQPWRAADGPTRSGYRSLGWRRRHASRSAQLADSSRRPRRARPPCRRTIGPTRAGSGRVRGHRRPTCTMSSSAAAWLSRTASIGRSTSRPT